MHVRRRGWPQVEAAFVLPVATFALFAVGAASAAAHGGLPSTAVTVMCAVLASGACLVATPAIAVPVFVVAWMSATAFARAPYGQLRPFGHLGAAAGLAVGGAVAGATLVAFVARACTGVAAGVTLDAVTGLAGFARAVDRRRRALGVAAGAASLPLLTVVLTSVRAHLSLADEVLLYLIVVVTVAVVGGFWPAVTAAIASSLLLNWYFTRPFHTFTIAAPDNLLALLLFIVVATTVSSVVHLSARRAQEAARNRAEAQLLLHLARMVLGGDDTPAAVLDHLHRTLGVGAQLKERVGARWVTVASAGSTEGLVHDSVSVRSDLMLVVHGDVDDDSRALVEAAAGQSAAALDRDRLRTQAAQAEALAAGNRMRTALLAAVSHDLRTPLAAIKASITSLRQTDVAWSPEDEAALLETIEESTDRLAALIANLLDMSRVQTGALQPFLQPASLDEIVPLALRGLAEAASVAVDAPDDLPLVFTDAGLLERALANLLSNALRYSPLDRPPSLVARRDHDRMQIAVVDHGPGVAQTDRGRMFEPFQRLGDQTSGDGVGLGLAVARGFVEAVGGTLTAGDTPGGGLTMTVSLPLAPVAARDTETSAP